MAPFPEYQDALAAANLKKGQLPFYIKLNTIHRMTRLHHHDFAELSLVVEGRGTEIVNGKAHEMRPGAATFLLPHHVHEIYSEPGRPIRLYSCMFDLSVLFGPQADDELGSLLLQAGDALPSFNQLDERQTAEMKDVCAKLLREYAESNVARNSYMRTKLVEALLLYVRSHAPALADRAERAAPDGHRPIWDIVQYVHTHYLNRLTLDDLAERFGSSVSGISRSFKEALGLNFLDYVHALRVRRATGLLATTGMTVQDIAEDVGFDSYRTFSRVFKQLKGVTPSEFRRGYRESLAREDGEPGAGDIGGSERK
ncbi:helix-turn-helix domain-containing protein [Paenibacillus flagellatus]|uniref:HTH araC/xylS-type domain-containing protein n=1 Tax=Paenibacillus flagellatus TaxID=2211139 RepID=A0A2V5KEH3_9BACL|nr:AraC family transcriptional regulator [Paenibacillus flagellatus]PYI57512.1 hypothetical protein DLM86_03520 [Paenibacillus flagellatus]